jgi:hypothetical protein
MDVRMPDGTIVTNVPRNITQEDLLERYQSYQPLAVGAPNNQYEVEPGFFRGIGSLLQSGAESAILSNKISPTVIGGGDVGALAPDIFKELTADPYRPQALREVTSAFADIGEQGKKAKGVYGNVQSAGRVVAEVGKQLITNPQGVLYMTAEQAANMVPAILGMMSGAAIGTSVAGPVGGIVGGIGGGFATQAPGEIGSEFIGNVGKELQARGMQVTPANIEALLNDKEFTARAISESRTKGATTAAVDAAFTLGAGKIAAAPRKAALAAATKELGEQATAASKIARAQEILKERGFGQKIVTGGKAVGTEVVGGGASEAAGSLAAYGDVDWGNIGLEMLGELGGSAFEVPAAARALREKVTGGPEPEKTSQDVQPDLTSPMADLTSPIVATMKTTVGGKESIKTTRADGSVDIDGVLVTPPRQAPEGGVSQSREQMLAEFEGRQLPLAEQPADQTPPVVPQDTAGLNDGDLELLAQVTATQPAQFTDPDTGTAIIISLTKLNDPALKAGEEVVYGGKTYYTYVQIPQKDTSGQLELAPVNPEGTVLPTPPAAPPVNTAGQLTLAPVNPEGTVLPTPAPKQVAAEPVAKVTPSQAKRVVAEPTVRYGITDDGETGVPLSEGGKPFATRKEAEAIKALQPQLRILTLKNKGKVTGYVLADKTQKQLAAEKVAAKRLQAIPVGGLLGDMLRQGGIDPVHRAELGFDKNENPLIGNRRLFAAQGKGVSLSSITEGQEESSAAESEYTGRDIDVQQSLPERIKEELRQYNEGGTEATGVDALEQRLEAEYQDFLAAEQEAGNATESMLDAGYTEQDLNVVGFTKASPELKAEVAALEAQMEALGLDASDIIAEIAFTPNITELEYYTRAKSELTKAITQATKQGSGGNVSQANVSAASEGLESPTEAGLKAKQEAADKAAAEKAKADREAVAKDKAEAERKAIAAASEKAAGEFKLGKSAEDDLSGQEDIFAIADKVGIPPEMQAPADFVLKEGRIKEVVLAAQALADGKITKAEYDKYVDFYAPIATIPNPEPPLDAAGMKRVLKSNQVSQINPEIAEGTRVGIRMDINALRRSKALSEKEGKKVSGSVVSIHKGSDIAKQGAIIGYSGVASIKNARFAIRNEQAAFKVAQNIEDKSPQQTIEGEWVNITPEDAYARVKSLLKDPNWAQVSLDPLRHSFFYDRSNRQPVTSADEILQVGRFVLAKNVKYAPRESFLYDVGRNQSQRYESQQSSDEIRKENIAKYASLKQRLSAIQRRFVNEKTQRFDEFDYRNLYKQAQDLKSAIDSTKEAKTTPADFLARAAKEFAADNISQDVFDVINTLYQKNPSLLDGLRLSVKTRGEGNSQAQGMFLPFPKIIRLFKRTSGVEDPSTIRHEIVHTLEQMMPYQAQAALVDAWAKGLLKASKKAKTDPEKKFFVAVGKFLDKPTQDSMVDAINAMPDYSYYQYINPSEFWAVNAEPLMQAYLGGAWQRFKSSVRGLFEAMKKVFGFDNKSVIYKTFNSVLNSERDSPMLVDYVSTVKNMLPINAVQQNLPNMPIAPNKPNKISPASLQKPKPAAVWTAPDMNRKDTFIGLVQDRNISLKRVQQVIEKLPTVTQLQDNLNAYRLEDLAHGRVQVQTDDFLKFEFGPIVKEMNDNKVTEEQLTEYLLNRHAKEANELIAKRNPNNPAMQDKGSSVETKVAEDYLKNLPPAQKKLFESLAKKVDDVIIGTQELLYKNGIISKAELDGWRDTFKYYVPLRREETDYVLPSSSFKEIGSYSKSRTGSQKKVTDILSNVGIAREIAIVRSEKEKAKRAVYGLAVANPNPEFWMAVSPAAVLNQNLLIQELSQMGWDPAYAKNIMAEPTKAYFNKDTGLVEHKINTQNRYADFVLPVKINGQDRFVFFNPNDERAASVITALKKADTQKLNAINSYVGNITRYFAAVNTQYNLVFGAWNFVRDVQGAMLNLTTTPLNGKQGAVAKGTFTALKDIYAGIKEKNKGTLQKNPADGSWQDFLEAGGKIGYRDQFAKINDTSTLVARELQSLNRSNAYKKARSVLNWVSSVNDVLENAVRLSAYRVALQQNLSKDQAAEIAKNLTVNFNRKGSATAGLSAYYAFLNASIQGTARLAQTIDPRTKSGRLIIAGGMAIGMAQSLALMAAGFDDDEPSEFLKERNLIIPTGWLTGKRTYAMWPMPLGFNILPNTGRLLIDGAARLADGKGVGDIAINALSMAVSSTNPLGGNAATLQSYMPTIADPFVAVYENKDSFGRPIAKEDRGLNPTPGYTRSREPANPIFQGIAEFMNNITSRDPDVKGLISPTADQLSYIAEQIGGGVYREASRAVKYAVNVLNGEETPEHQVPLAGKIIGDLGSNSAISQKFYTNVKNMAEHELVIKAHRERRQSTAEYMRDNPEARLWQRANSLENEITKLNKTKKDLYQREAPKERIKRVEDQKIRMMQQFNDQVRRVN